MLVAPFQGHAGPAKQAVPPAAGSYCRGGGSRCLQGSRCPGPGLGLAVSSDPVRAQHHPGSADRSPQADQRGSKQGWVARPGGVTGWLLSPHLPCVLFPAQRQLPPPGQATPRAQRLGDQVSEILVGRPAKLVRAGAWPGQTSFKFSHWAGVTSLVPSCLRPGPHAGP